MSSNTTLMTKGDISPRWFLIDAKGQVLGRIATKIADILRGKDKSYFSPSTDTGDFVIVVNADKVILTGKKLQNKLYHSHSGYPGGIKSVPAVDLLKKHPEELILKAVDGMLPKNKLRKRFITKLKIYAGGEHPHAAQNPVELKFEDRSI